MITSFTVSLVTNVYEKNVCRHFLSSVTNKLLFLTLSNSNNGIKNTRINGTILNMSVFPDFTRRIIKRLRRFFISFLIRVVKFTVPVVATR